MSKPKDEVLGGSLVLYSMTFVCQSNFPHNRSGIETCVFFSKSMNIAFGLTQCYN